MSKGCIRIVLDDDGVSRGADISIVPDDHLYGLDDEGFMHYPFKLYRGEATHGGKSDTD